MTPNLQFATIWEQVADAIPERDVVVQGTERLTWRDYDDRSARLACALSAAGLTSGARVALYLFNSPAYAEVHFAALKQGLVPVNVNYRYLERELGYLLEDSGAQAVVFHHALVDTVAAIRNRLPAVRLWIQVGGDPADLGPGVTHLESLIGAHHPAERIARDADGVYMIYTGGTTGMPKGVMYRMGEYVHRWLRNAASTVGERPAPDDPEMMLRQVLERVAQRPRSGWLVGCPLMHGTGLQLGLFVPHVIGAPTVLLPSRSLDVDELWDVVEKERVEMIVVSGDAFVRPMIRALEQAAARSRPRDLACVKRVFSSGSMLSLDAKNTLLHHLSADAVIVDAIGSTEGGVGMAVAGRGRPATTARFAPEETTRVVGEDGRFVTAGSGERGLLAVSGLGNVPIGYHNDPERSARTFPTIDGVRYSVSGDWATVEADGSITLLGRGSGCINTGGEKVFAEEVEQTLKTHPAVEDCLVFAVPDERLGQTVAAVVALAPGATADPAELAAWTDRELTSYKRPRRLVVVDVIPRRANAKPDYAAAWELLEASERAGLEARVDQ
jgi:fatty-acyl-CoA synthase